MQITIEAEAGKEGEGSKRKVARDVDMENFTVVDEVCCRLSRQFPPKIVILRLARWRAPKLTCRIPRALRSVARWLRLIRLSSRRERRKMTESPQKAETSVVLQTLKQLEFDVSFLFSYQEAEQSHL